MSLLLCWRERYVGSQQPNVSCARFLMCLALVQRREISESVRYILLAACLQIALLWFILFQLRHQRTGGLSDGAPRFYMCVEFYHLRWQCWKWASSWENFLFHLLRFYCFQYSCSQIWNLKVLIILSSKKNAYEKHVRKYLNFCVADFKR